jgi:hypothetical protein
MAAHLRVFSEDGPESFDLADRPEPSVRVSLGDLLPLLSIAKKHNYLWLQDFLDDEVAVTPDLYEILRAFGHYQKTPA